MRNYTRNEWRRCKTTLETSVDFSMDFFRTPAGRILKDDIGTWEISLKKPYIQDQVHWFQVSYQSGDFHGIFYTRFECNFTSCPLVSSSNSHLLHSLRVQIHIFSTHYECKFTSSQLITSANSHLLHSFRVYFHQIFCLTSILYTMMKNKKTKNM